MSLMDDVPPGVLADTMEKVVSRMDERELADALTGFIEQMPADARDALVEAVFDVFRDRGESSEDAAEGAGTSVEAVRLHQVGAVNALLAYGVESTGVLKAAMEIFAEEHPDKVAMLPPQLVAQLNERLSAAQE